MVYDLFKIINNDDGEVIITEDQPEEVADPELSESNVRYY